MSTKVSITLDDEILHFIDARTANRSSFINEILRREKQRIFLQELAAAYQAQAADPDLQVDVEA
ncbi:MAG: hypothetical protein HC910_12405 [Spirulinaceae cyanobacterium SM2_1_0]|nr:hypothetical protein [Spirulinaceae cyanobacterium SM2_1_0]NJO51659.1 hypothetical protein [Leptolyngbyaceae cyanobacterium RM2_2_4]